MANYDPAALQNFKGALKLWDNWTKPRATYLVERAVEDAKTLLAAVDRFETQSIQTPEGERAGLYSSALRHALYELGHGREVAAWAVYRLLERGYLEGIVKRRSVAFDGNPFVWTTRQLDFVSSGKVSGQVDGSQDVGSAPTWPRPRGWDFQPGEAAYDGTRFPIVGIKAEILKYFAKKPANRAVEISELHSALWKNKAINDETIVGHISLINKLVREGLGLEESDKVIKNRGTKSHAYELKLR